MVGKLNPISSPRGSSGERNAFTLLELLAVMAIVVIVFAFALQGFTGMSRNLNLVDGGSLVAAELDLARQTAMVKNQTVEVRFYRNEAGGNYDTVASLIPANPNIPGSRPEWIGKPGSLPTGVIFDVSDPSYSSLITGTSGSSPKGYPPDSASPLLLRTKSYTAFHFRSDGSTDLDETYGGGGSPAPWCVTLRNLNGPAGQAGTPGANFITLLLDPVLGRSRLFQPH